MIEKRGFDNERRPFFILHDAERVSKESSN